MPGRGPRPVNLSEIGNIPDTPKSSTADTEITGAIADRVAAIARGTVPETVDAILKRSLAEADPLGMAIKRAGLFRGGISEQILRDALIGRDLASEASAIGVSGSLIDRATIAAARGSVIDRATRDIVEADKRMSELILGPGFAGRHLSAIQEAQARAGPLKGGSRHPQAKDSTIR